MTFGAFFMCISLPPLLMTLSPSLFAQEIEQRKRDKAADKAAAVARKEAEKQRREMAAMVGAKKRKMEEMMRAEKKCVCCIHASTPCRHKILIELVSILSFLFLTPPHSFIRCSDSFCHFTRLKRREENVRRRPLTRRGRERNR
jgi:hypothetical protein